MQLGVLGGAISSLGGPGGAQRQTILVHSELKKIAFCIPLYFTYKSLRNRVPNMSSIFVTGGVYTPYTRCMSTPRVQQLSLRIGLQCD